MAFTKEIEEAILSVANEEGIEGPALLAVVSVESNGKAYAEKDFPGENKPLILYEYHVFYRNLPVGKRREAVRRGLASRSWGAISYPRGQKARYALLERAMKLDESAAYEACSYGVGQVLGENWEWLGYASPKALYEEAASGIDGQVRLMLRFIKKRGLVDEINNHDWTGFARAYNGPRHHEHNYAGKMAAAYKKHAGGGADVPHDDIPLHMGAFGDDVAKLQRSLRALGYHLIVDGDFGPATRRAVIAFQEDNGLASTGVADAKTLGVIDALSGVNIG